jgi:ring-1,2-phenylacetyl-CoA epoxidase subunit PaaE
VSTHFHKLTVKDIRDETPECVSIAFNVPAELQEQFQFIHGQNITIKTTVDNEEIRRSYSICSSPLENELRIAVKKISNGKFSDYVHKLGTGDSLDVLTPTGKFYTPLNHSNKKDYIAFAAGSGITPIISIIKTTLATEQDSSFTLINGNKGRSSIIFKEELEAIKNRFMSRFAVHHILSREKTDAPIYNGRITAQKCDELDNKLIDMKNGDEFFLCGPEEMIFIVKDWLEKKGIDKKKIHFELFTVPGQKAAESSRYAAIDKNQREGKSSNVTIKLDGIFCSFDLLYSGLPILDAALKQGVDLPFACRGGVCSTCRAKLIEGKVEMDNNYALEPDELEKGFILTCQSHPQTERLIIDFDAK